VKGLALAREAGVPGHIVAGALCLFTLFFYLLYIIHIWMYGIYFLYWHGIKPEELKLWLCGRENRLSMGKSKEGVGMTC